MYPDEKPLAAEWRSLQAIPRGALTCTSSDEEAMPLHRHFEFPGGTPTAATAYWRAHLRANGWRILRDDDERFEHRFGARKGHHLVEISVAKRVVRSGWSRARLVDLHTAPIGSLE
jgi:hypothetical protein